MPVDTINECDQKHKQDTSVNPTPTRDSHARIMLRDVDSFKDFAGRERAAMVCYTIRVKPETATQKPETTKPDEDKHSFNWGWIAWPCVILFLYGLSLGPALLMQDKGHISPNNQFLRAFYAPLSWAYKDTPFHKPLGMYLHLWVPKYFDGKGNVRDLFQ